MEYDPFSQLSDTQQTLEESVGSCCCAKHEWGRDAALRIRRGERTANADVVFTEEVFVGAVVDVWRRVGIGNHADRVRRGPRQDFTEAQLHHSLPHCADTTHAHAHAHAHANSTGKLFGPH